MQGDKQQLGTLLQNLIDETLLKDYTPENSVAVDCAYYLISLMEGDVLC
jgi:hypothetical protein